MTPDKDGWIKHDGGPCPVCVERWVQCREHNGRETKVGRPDDFDWLFVAAYRVFAPVTPGPSPFVRETAARIMAGFAAHPNYMADPHADWAAEAVNAALTLEAAMKEVKP